MDTELLLPLMFPPTPPHILQQKATTVTKTGN